MFSRSTLRTAALTSTCLLPLLALAQQSDFDLSDAPVAPRAAPVNFDNQVAAGVRYQSSDSALFGRYDGLPYKGLSGTLDFSLRSGDAWDSGGTHYFRAEGSDITVNGHDLAPDASASVKYGEQGLWGLNVFYQGISYVQSLKFHSLLTPSGALQVAPYSLDPLYNLNNTALATNAQGGPPAGAPLVINNARNFGTATFSAVTTNPLTGAVTGGGATPAQIRAANNAVASSIAAIDNLSLQFVGTQRQKIGMGGDWSPLTDWSFNASFDHEHKEGTKENSMAMNNKDNVTYFPEPVNYDVDTYKAQAKYNTPGLQGVLSYSYSRFTDNHGSFNTLLPWAPAVADGPGYAGTSYSLPPSNDAHMIRGMLAYTLTPTTRINLNAGYSLMQNNSGSPLGYIGAPINPFIGSNYQAQNQNLFGNLAISSRPIAGSDIRVSYTIDDKQDNSTRVFIPASADGSTSHGVTAPYGMIAADATGTNDVPVANLPVSLLTQTAKADASYVLTPGTKLSLNYGYVDKQRNYSVTDHNHENSFGARLNSMVGNEITGSIGLTHAVRTADAYLASGAWFASTFTDTNNPGLGMYYLAARTRDELKASLNWSPDAFISAGLTAKFYNDHYPDSFFGVTNDHKLSVGPDIAYTPSKSVSVQAYYTYEEVFTDQNFSNTNSPTAAYVDWTLGNKDSIHIVGARLEWQLDEKIKLTLNDDLSYGATAFAEGYSLLASSTGAPVSQTPTNLVSALPDNKTITNFLGIKVDYKMRDNLTLIGNYGFDRAVAKDYLYGQTAGLNTSAGVASLPGDGNPSYSEQIFMVSARLKW
jgi:MtrB/PioB family decaheme-associated outer membrane protein